MSFRMSAQAATPLQAARIELGWKQAQTIHALRQAAGDEGLPIASARSLKTMLSRWENGHDCADGVGQRLLCRVYGRTPEDLGFGRRGGAAGPPVKLAPAVGPELVGYFRTVLMEHVRADNLFGPHHLVDVVRAQAALLDQTLPSARGAARRELLFLALRYSEFAGWLCHDAGDAKKALHFTDRAMDYALEAGAARETAYVLMRKADIAADLGRPDRAIGLADVALRGWPRVPPRVRALALRVRGRAYAQLGKPDECARALAAAHEEVARPLDGPDDLTAYCAPSYVDMEAARCWTALGRLDSAIAAYERSLRHWPDDLRRDQGLCLARVASAYAGRGDVERACAAGRRAVDVIRLAPSSRAIDQLQRTRVGLAPWRRHAEVSDLSDRIRALTRPAA